MNLQYRITAPSTRKSFLIYAYPAQRPTCRVFDVAKRTPLSGFPTVAVIMGPNGSGKTTLLRALLDLTRIAFGPDLSASQAAIGRVLPFWSNKAANEPTRFRLEFDADWLQLGGARELFRYELSIGRVTSERHPFILREALFHFPKGRPKRLFERGAPGEAIYASSEFGLKPKDARSRCGPERYLCYSTAFAALNVPLAMHIVTEALGDRPPYRRTSCMMRILGSRRPTETVVSFYERNEQGEKLDEMQQMQRSDLAIHDVSFTQRVTSGETDALLSSSSRPGP